MTNKKWTKAFKSFQILVLGSISNMGCGFDTLGLAVSLYFKTSVHSAPDFQFEATCNGKPLHLAEDDNLFLKVLRQCYPVSPDDWQFHIQIETEVPPRRGLQKNDRLIRLAAGLALLGVGLYTGFTWWLLGLAGMALFSAVYDRCPIWRALSRRVGQLLHPEVSARE